MFGDPFEVSYFRWTKYIEGGFIVTSQANKFVAPLWDSLLRLLLFERSPLLFSAPILIISLLFGYKWVWRESKKEAIFMLSIWLAQLIFFSKYQSSYSKARYLISLVSLNAIPLSYAARNFLVDQK